MSEVFVIEAADLDGESVGSSDGVPTAPVAWPDGRIDVLPHTCTDLNIYPNDVMDDLPFLHLGWRNIFAGMTGGYGSENLARLGPDVFYSRTGDVEGGDTFTHYLRGEFRAAAEKWLADIVSYDTPGSFPWDALVLCSHYDLLASIPRDREGGYEVNLFLPVPEEDLTGCRIDFDQDLTETEMGILVQAFEAAGCTWPRNVVEGNEEETSSWEERLRDWT